jgi:hypothetical protein
MPKYVLTAPDGRKFNVTAPEGATEDEIIKKASAQLGYATDAEQDESGTSSLIDPFPGVRSIEDIPIRRSIGRTLSRGFERGLTRTGSLLGDVLPAVGASALGFDDYARAQMEEAAATEAALQETNPAEFQSFRDIEDLGGAFRYGVEKIGEQGANILTSIGTGGAGAAIGNVLAKRAGTAAAAKFAGQFGGLGGKAAEKYATAAGTAARAASPAVAQGATAGAFAGSAALSIPEVFQNIYEKTGELAPAMSLLFGSGAAALDAIFPAQILKGFRGSPEVTKAVVAEIAKRKGFIPKSLRRAVRSALGSIAKNAALEGVTEGAQEALSITAEQIVDETENFWGQEEFDRIIESMVAGSVVGGGISTPGAVVKGLGARKETPPPPPEGGREVEQTEEEIDVQRPEKPLSARDEFSRSFRDRIEAAATPEEVDTIVNELAPAAGKFQETTGKAIYEGEIANIRKSAYGKRNDLKRSIAQAREKEKQEKIQSLIDGGYSPEAADLYAKRMDELQKKTATGEGVKTEKKESAATVAAERLAGEGDEQVSLDDVVRFTGLEDRNAALRLIPELIAGKNPSLALVPGRSDLFKNLRFSVPEGFPSKFDWMGLPENKERLAGVPATEMAALYAQDKKSFAETKQKTEVETAAKQKELGAVANTFNRLANKDGITFESLDDAQKEEVLTSFKGNKNKLVKEQVDALSFVKQRREDAATAAALGKAGKLAPVRFDQVLKKFGLEFKALSEQEKEQVISKYAERGALSANDISAIPFVQTHVKAVQDKNAASIAKQKELREQQVAQEAAQRKAEQDAKAKTSLLERAGNLYNTTAFEVTGKYFKDLNEVEQQQVVDAYVAGGKKLTKKSAKDIPFVKTVLDAKAAREAELARQEAARQEAARQEAARQKAEADAAAAQGEAESTEAESTEAESTEAEPTAVTESEPEAKPKEAKPKTEKKAKKKVEPEAEEQEVDSPDKTRLISERDALIAEREDIDNTLSDIKESKPKNATEKMQLLTLEKSLNKRNEDIAKRISEINIEGRTKGYFSKTPEGEARAAFLPDERLAIYGPGVEGDTKELRALRAHEVGAHYAVGRMLGPEKYAALLKDLRRIRDGSKFVQEAYAAVPKDTPAKLKDHEALGYLVEKYERMPIVKRLLQMVKDWYAKTFRGEALTATDLRKLIKSAMDAHGMEVREQFLTEGTVEKAVGGKRADYSKVNLGHATQLASNKPLVRDWVVGTMDKMVNSTPRWGKPAAEKIASVLGSTAPNTSKKAVMTLMDMQDLADYTQPIDSGMAQEIRALEKTATYRDFLTGEAKKRVTDFLLASKKTVAKFSKAQVEKFDFLVTESTIGGIDFKNKDFADHPLTKQYKAMPKELRDLYDGLRNEYQNYTKSFFEYIKDDEVLGDASKLLVKLFSKKIDPFFPLGREGTFWLSYPDPTTNEEGVTSFKTEKQLREFVQELIKNGADPEDIRQFSRVGAYSADNFPATSEIRKIIALLEKNGADPAIVDSVYQTYLDMFPNTSVMQQFQKRKNTPGYRTDALDVFADVGTRMALAASQFGAAKEIDAHLKKVTELAGGARTDPKKALILDSVQKRVRFLKNPVQSDPIDRMAAQFGFNAYRYFIMGNVSSAVVNLTTLPIVTYGMLMGEFGPVAAARAMKEASKMYFAGGSDNNTTMVNRLTGKMMTDLTFGGDKAKLSPEYAALYEAAKHRTAIRRSTGMELADMRQFGIEDPTSKMTAIQHWLSWLFQNSERYNREITLLSMYRLSRAKGMSPEVAREKAIDFVTRVNSAASSEVGPQFTQHGIGRVIGTFKRFAIKQIFLIADLTRKSLSKDVDPEIRKVAVRQLLGIHAMSFMVAGLKGMPVFGAVNLLASLLSGFFGDEGDEPLDLDQYVLSNWGQAVYRGPLSALLNADFGSRSGFGELLWRTDEKRIAEIGAVHYAIEQAAGPIAGIVRNIGSAFDYWEKGQAERAIEAAMPSAIRNLMKGYRFATEGALNSKGVPIDEDISGKDALFQMIGITPNDLAEKYAKASVAASWERKGQEKRANLLMMRNMALNADDYDRVSEVEDEMYKFNETDYGKIKPITPKVWNNSWKGFQDYINASVYGLKLDKKTRNRALEVAGIED